MPNVSITLTDFSQSTTRPIVTSVVQQLQEIVKVPAISKIFYPGDSQIMQAPGSSIDDHRNRDAMFGSDRYTFIEVEEYSMEEYTGNIVVNKPEHIPVFRDECGTLIRPIYDTVQVVVNYKYRTTSKTEAQRWHADMRLKIASMREYNLHAIEYHYPIPNIILSVLNSVYQRREAVEGYGESFEAYLRKHCTHRLKLISTVTGDDAKLVISEKQTRIVGLYDFDDLPEKPEHEPDTGTWSISFPYKFTYEKPIACNFIYPAVVHNQLMPHEYVNVYEGVWDIDSINKSFTKSLYAMNGFEVDTVMGSRKPPVPYFQIPTWDEYVIEHVPPGTGTVFSALCLINEDDRRTLLNLNDLGDIVLNQDILAFIKAGEIPELSKLYRSVLHLSLYKNDRLQDPQWLEVDDDLNVRAIKDLDLRSVYHVRLSIVTDLVYLPRDAINRLRQHPRALYTLIGSINEIIKYMPDFTNYGDKKEITWLEFSPLYEFLTGYGYHNNHKGRNGDYYTPGRNIQAWPMNPQSSASSLYGRLDPKLIERFRREQYSPKRAMVTGIIAPRKV